MTESLHVQFEIIDSKAPEFDQSKKPASSEALSLQPVLLAMIIVVFSQWFQHY